MNNKFKILIVGLVAISAAALCSANHAPPAPVAEKVIGLDAAQIEMSDTIALCDETTFKLSADVFAVETVVYGEFKSVAIGRAIEIQAPRSAKIRTCSRPFDYLAKHSTVAELRQPKAGKEPAYRM